jgi:hypothetical protein
VLFSPHLVVQRARVGTAALRQQDVRLIEGEPALALALALAPPRLWGYVLDATLDGFADGYARPHDGKVSTRIHQGLRVAQTTLRARIDALIDRRAVDVSLLALACEGRVLHLLTTGALGAYVYRQRGIRRLSLREPAVEGVLHAEPAWCAEPAEPGDLVIAASTSVCTDANLERVREACIANRYLEASAVTGLLAQSAADTGEGAVVAAFRVSE